MPSQNRPSSTSRLLSSYALCTVGYISRETNLNVSINKIGINCALNQMNRQLVWREEETCLKVFSTSKIYCKFKSSRCKFKNSPKVRRAKKAQKSAPSRIKNGAKLKPAFVVACKQMALFMQKTNTRLHA